MVTHDCFLIGSRWVDARGDSSLNVVSPSTEEVVGRVPISTTEDMDAAVLSARRAFDNGPWPRMSVRARGHYLLAMAEILRSKLDDLVRTQIDEMGSPRCFIEPGTRGILESIPSQIDLVESIPTRMVRSGGGGQIVVSREPLGVTAAIIPWNAPVPLIIARMLPTLLTGSTLVVKPAAESPLSAYLVAEAAISAGLPEGVLSLVPGGPDVGEHLVVHSGVDKVAFTGSTSAGRQVAALCGEHLKHSTLELGGKSAAIVLEDVDLDARLASLITSAMPNTGQVCYATTRILVPRSRSSEIVDALAAAVASMKVGDPHDADTRIGPLVAERQRDRVESYIRSGREQGAAIVLGGGRPRGLDRGWFVEPTIFAHVDNSLKIAQEEIFGPVLCLIDYESVDEAVAIANDSQYGLGGGVFTEDVVHALDIVSKIRTGTCVINSGAPGGGGGPFGGMKNSGLGRERGIEGYASCYELKSVALPAGVDIGR